jgi:hypothetical protein
MPVAALAVHQLRFFLAFGSKGSDQLAETGHSYLHSLTPWLMLLVALGCGAFVGRLARARRSGDADSARHPGLVGLWLVAAAALVVIYAGQEFLEGLFATGHPTGLAGIFGDGGWWALPAALVVGAALALIARGGRAALALAARIGRARAAHARRSAPRPRPRPVFLIAASPLAGCSPERAPPFAS